MIKIKWPFKKKEPEEIRIQEFLDRVSPSRIRFFTDYYLCGNTYRCVWAIRDYPTSTEDQALLRYLGEKENITVKIYTRMVTSLEEKKIISNAANKNKMNVRNIQNIQDAVEAQSNLNDVTTIIANMHRSREPLMHCAVYLELQSTSEERLRILQTDVLTELTRSKMNVDRLMLRQQEGFLSVSPAGYNCFNDQFERVLPASSVANLYPMNYSGKTDPQGFMLGKDKYGSNIIVDFDRRMDDKTNSNILILGNSGEGKSYLLKLILINQLEAGKRLVCLDPEDEYEDLFHNLNGDYIDLMAGNKIINVLEPKRWATAEQESENEELPAFTAKTVLSQHIAFLKDFFQSYKELSNAQIDVLEIMLVKLYETFGMTDDTDFSCLAHQDYPILSDLYELCEKEYQAFDSAKTQLYTKEMLQGVCLALYSICKGSDSQYFNGITNIKDSGILCFGAKGLLETNKYLRNALLFNILSYMSNQLLTIGNTVASIDEFYLFLNNLVAVEYIRNFEKRVRKKESAIILASQNIEDYDMEGIREYTRPLFAIPTHQFLFYPGTIEEKKYLDMLQLEKAEFDLIRYPQRGTCLYRCGNERYNLQVQAPEYKEILFGTAGGR